jgi:hypothetical protein
MFTFRIGKCELNLYITLAVFFFLSQVCPRPFLQVMVFLVRYLLSIRFRFLVYALPILYYIQVSGVFLCSIFLIL